MMATRVLMATGKDVFGCRSQLKADGFFFDGDLKRWIGTQENVDKFKARGFKVKVFFADLDASESLSTKLREAGLSI
jgi:hypothetical protein